jgi:adenylyl-sulfate kinase
MSSTLQNVGPLVHQNISVEKGCTYFLTGLSGCGKSTLAEAMKKHLDAATGNSKRVFCLDGDIIRQGLNAKLGFTAEDRKENIRRIGEVSKLMNAAGQIVFCSFIAPEEAARTQARETHEANGQDFVEVYVCPSKDECIKRDPKGLYKKALAGTLPNFTGISAPYDEPKDALNIDTEKYSLDECMRILQADMFKNGCIKDNSTRPVV